MKFLFRIAALVAFGLVALAATAFAHDPGLSSANIDVRARTLEVQLIFNGRDIAGVLNAHSAQPVGIDDKAALERLAGRAAAVTAGTSLPAQNVSASVDENQNVIFHSEFAIPAGASAVVFSSTLLPELPFG
ncbi:MAG: hypothetical protein M3Y86_10055, partial [Verrucomicrobiota bacterium]|nr:hypothetical protein [Verrucomicrobiota bacterium]